MNAASDDAGRFGSQSRAGPAAQTAREIVLRLLAVALQILATIVIVRTLEPRIAGVFLRGVVISGGLAALLRYRYELYLAPHIAGGIGSHIPTHALVMELSRSFLIRCSLVCAILLVVTADLDVLAPREFPYFQTYLPFVLAIPFIGLSQLLATALRAAERSLLSMVCSAYTVNSAILCAGVLALHYDALASLAWAFLGGCIFAAALAWWFARIVFRTPLRASPQDTREHGDSKAWWHVYESVAANSAIAIALALTLWGPAVILAVLASSEDIARYAIAARTAQVADLLLPALTFVLCAERPLFLRRAWDSGARSALLPSFGVAALASTVVFAVLLLAARKTLALYGEPYREVVAVYALLLAAHWINGAGRPGVRFLVANWNAAIIRKILDSGAVLAVLIAAAGLSINAPMAAAIAMLVSALWVNATAGVAASRRLDPERRGVGAP